MRNKTSDLTHGLAKSQPEGLVAELRSLLGGSSMRYLKPKPGYMISTRRLTLVLGLVAAIATVPASASQLVFSSNKTVYAKASHSDVKPPTTPGDLRVSSSSQTSISISWHASRDNVKVAGYDVYFNGQLAETTQEPRTSSANCPAELPTRLELPPTTALEIHRRSRASLPVRGPAQLARLRFLSLRPRPPSGQPPGAHPRVAPPAAPLEAPPPGERLALRPRAPSRTPRPPVRRPRLP